MTIAKLLALALFAIAIAACSTATKVKADLGVNKVPDWVGEGSVAISNANGRAFRGVGSASFMGDVALQKSVAEDRARAEVARILLVYLERIFSGHIPFANAGDDAVTEEAVMRQIRNLSKDGMAGTKITGNWRDSKTKIAYSVAELDMSYVKGVLAGANNMSKNMRRHIEIHGESTFDRLAKAVTQ